jgi:hypothetical protein
MKNSAAKPMFHSLTLTNVLSEFNNNSASPSRIQPDLALLTTLSTNAMR